VFSNTLIFINFLSVVVCCSQVLSVREENLCLCGEPSLIDVILVKFMCLALNCTCAISSGCFGANFGAVFSYGV